LQLAECDGLDLVVVAEASVPPVVKPMDFNKEKYRQAKSTKKGKKTVVKNKEVKFSPHIEENDYRVKLDRIKKFLDKKMRVKVSVYFKGRQITHKDSGIEVLNRVIKEVEGVGKVDSPVKANGRNVFMVLIADS
jgi:translation initiation factor IF-3